MREQAKIFGLVVVIIGLLLSFISSVVPFFTSGYHVMAGVLFAGIVPYLIYGLVVVMLPDVLTIIVGVVLLVVDSWLVISERFINGANYSGGTIYYVPIVLTISLIPLVFLAARAAWHK